MNTTLAALIVFGCLVAAVLPGRILRRLLPETGQNLTRRTRHACRYRRRAGVTGISEGKGLAHLSLAFRFPGHTVTATAINLIVT